jgi:hypothetical protein
MFQLVECYELVPGEKYLVGPNQWEWYFVREMYYKQRYCVFESVKHSKPNNQYQISIQEDFYQFVPQKARIQSEMERRAVNLIVRRLLGDECFEW